MEHKPVQSSNIAEIGYDPEAGTLSVKFKGGGHYHYSNVPQDKYEQLLKSSSIGTFLSKHIKNTHKHLKIK